MTVEDIALTFVPRLGVRGIVHLLETFSSASAIYAASERELVEEAELRADIARSIVRKEGMAAAERELLHCEKSGIDVLASTDADYPESLLATPDYPHVLYMVGGCDVMFAPRISIVGTRKMTPYGERACNAIVERIAELCPDAVVVSGLAFGTDAAAHRAALAYGLRTVGVIASALPGVTPTQNSALARDMVEHGGAVITEVTSQTPQNGNLYIPRNRIVAALGEGLVVVESPTGGGSLSTVQAADSYARPVMAVPGRVFDAMSAGTNRLIRSRVAQPVLSGDDCVTELGWRTAEQSARQQRVEATSLTDAERKIFESIDEHDATPFDTMIARSGMTASEANALLLGLELAGVVRQLPGKMYERLC